MIAPIFLFFLFACSNKGTTPSATELILYLSGKDLSGLAIAGNGNPSGNPEGETEATDESDGDSANSGTTVGTDSFGETWTVPSRTTEITILDPSPGQILNDLHVSFTSGIQLERDGQTGFFSGDCSAPFRIRLEGESECISFYLESEDGISFSLWITGSLSPNRTVLFEYGPLLSSVGDSLPWTGTGSFLTPDDRSPPALVSHSGNTVFSYNWKNEFLDLDFSEPLDPEAVADLVLVACENITVQSGPILLENGKRLEYGVIWPEEVQDCTMGLEGGLADLFGNVVNSSSEFTVHVGAPPALLSISEVAPTVPSSSGGDYIELIVQEKGTLAGISVTENDNLLYAFADQILDAGERILLHLNGDGNFPAGTDETTGITDSIATGSSPFAYNYWSLDSGLTSTDGVIGVDSGSGSVMDLMAYSNRDGDMASSTMGLLGDLNLQGEFYLINPPENGVNDLEVQNQCVYFSGDSSRSLSRLPGYQGSGSDGWYDSAQSPGQAGSGNQAPGLSLARAISPATLEVVFSEDPDPASLQLDQISVSGPGSPVPVGMDFQIPDRLFLEMDTELQSGETYTLTIAGWTDRGGLEVDPTKRSTPFLGYGTPEAELRITEFLPGGSPDFVEFLVLETGATDSLQFCHRDSCLDFPSSRILQAGDRILFSAAVGNDDWIVTDGSLATAWEFFNLPPLTSTDSSLKIFGADNRLMDVVFYANGTGFDATTWTGCGSTGAIDCIDDAIQAGFWTLSGPSWVESDAVVNDGGSNGSIDFFQKCPEGGDPGKTGWIFQTDGTESSTPGEANLCF